MVGVVPEFCGVFTGRANAGAAARARTAAPDKILIRKLRSDRFVFATVFAPDR
jgi:hypothetical protein